MQSQGFTFPGLGADILPSSPTQSPHTSQMCGPLPGSPTSGQQYDWAPTMCKIFPWASE